LLALMALGVAPGEAVLVPAFTFAATAEAGARPGAVPLVVDVAEADLAMAPSSQEQGIATARRLGLRPVGAVAVDLYGHPAPYDRLAAVAGAAGLWLVADAAQSFGAGFRGRRVGTLARATAVSFYPSKPLGCYGDGGALLTDDPDLAALARSLREHGQEGGRYRHARIGTNARLDTLQAAILLEKLRIFEDETLARARIAERYRAGLAGAVDVPGAGQGASPVWAHYTVRSPARDALRTALAAAGIASAIHYPAPLHHQPAYRRFPTAAASLPVSERLAREVLSLPMHPYLAPEAQDRVIGAVQAATAGR
ncbi:MAG TPA: DegT/DnrJ/EryC1/StrS aminotransferase family protein, partial [Geminicoccaceae bacterium]|nr:DegT/DnrJ/EryC1/StrS aminotransferase family protein [Geminicoccaceae bacterium]